MKWSGIVLMGMLLSACSELLFWIANRPVELNGVAVSTRSYGDKDAQQLDIYRPQEAISAPVLVFFYGGGWQSGSKEQYRFIAEAFSEQGMVTVIPDYRKYPEVTFPVFIEDTAAATAWVVKHIEHYGGDASRIYVMGHSAGAYNAAMMLADAGYLARYDISSGQIAGFIGLAGPYNFTPEEPKYMRIFNNMDDYSPMKVNHYINGDEPPMLLLHGLADDTVSPENSKRLADALDKGGISHRLELLTDVNHYEIIGTYTDIWRDKAPQLRQAIETFIGLPQAAEDAP